MVKVRKGEDINDALRRFNQDLKRQGKLREIRKRDYYESKGEARRRKRKEARRF